MRRSFVKKIVSLTLAVIMVCGIVSYAAEDGQNEEQIEQVELTIEEEIQAELAEPEIINEYAQEPEASGSEQPLEDNIDNNDIITTPTTEEEEPTTTSEEPTTTPEETTPEIITEAEKEQDEVKNGWYNADGETYYYRDGSIVTDWQVIDGYWYYFDTYGRMEIDWQYIDNDWYYLDIDGRMLTGWQDIDDDRYYLSAGGRMRTGWQYIDNSWYYLSAGGRMRTGWQYIDNDWYYMDTDGVMLTGLRKVDGNYYFFKSSGKMVTGWLWLNDTWYYFKSSGKAYTGWQYVDNRWYYLAEDGEIATGWNTIGGSKYYFTQGGKMLTGWQVIDGYWYYFSSSGKMQTGWFYDNSEGEWVYLASSGKYMSPGYTLVDGTWWFYTAYMDEDTDGWSSPTNYFIRVDKNKHIVRIYKGSQYNWTCVKTFRCSVGALSSDTITPKGVYYTYNRGFSFGEGFTCYYWTAFYEDYLFHSIVYNEGTYVVQDATMGGNVSHGCVRLYIDNAKWIYNNVPLGTKVYIY